MNRKPCGRDFTLSSAMALAMLLLAGLYLVALAVPLWLHSVGSPSR
jgi:hypothetical protein